MICTLTFPETSGKTKLRLKSYPHYEALRAEDLRSSESVVYGWESW